MNKTPNGFNNLDNENLSKGGEYYIEQLILVLLTDIADKTDRGFELIFDSPLMDIKTFDNCKSQDIVSDSIILFQSVFIKLEDGIEKYENFFWYSLENHLKSLVSILYSQWSNIRVVCPCLTLINLILNFCIENNRMGIVETFKTSGGEDAGKNMYL